MTDPVYPMTPREEAALILAKNWFKRFGAMDRSWETIDPVARNAWLRMATDDLDEILSASLPEACSECGDRQAHCSLHGPMEPDDDGRGWHCAVEWCGGKAKRRCASCGSGTTAGPSLIHALAGLEQVGVWCPRGGGHADLLSEYDDEGEAWRDDDGNVHAPCSSKGGFALYRIHPPETETE